jgi:hypothetical protein
MATTTHAGRSASLLTEMSARLTGIRDEASARLSSKRPRTRPGRVESGDLVELMREVPGIVALCAFILGNAFIVYTFLKPWL